MNFGLSTQLFYPQRLTTSMLDAMASSGVSTIELFAARHHVDYTDRAQTRELAAWFRANPVAATLHAPLTTEPVFSRHAAPELNLTAPQKQNRIAAMEETKRALELAEQIAIASCVLHLGQAADQWSDYTLEYSLTAIEHLKAFAAPLGVRLLLENLPNPIATPAHLLEVLRIGHFDSCGVCFDLAHAHLEPSGLAPAFELLRPRIAELHVSDNDGRGDLHLWPASGTERAASAAQGNIDWAAAYALAATLPAPMILEVADTEAGTPEQAARLAREVISHAARLLEASEHEDPAAARPGEGQPRFAHPKAFSA